LPPDFLIRSKSRMKAQRKHRPRPEADLTCRDCRSTFFPILGQGILVKDPEAKPLRIFQKRPASPRPTSGSGPDRFPQRQGPGRFHRLQSWMATWLCRPPCRVWPGLCCAGADLCCDASSDLPEVDDSAATAKRSPSPSSSSTWLPETSVRPAGTRILIPAGQLKEFIERQGRWIWSGCVAAEADGRPVGAADVPGVLAGAGQVILTVKAGPGGEPVGKRPGPEQL
jgi:hypothetical protein